MQRSKAQNHEQPKCQSLVIRMNCYCVAKRVNRLKERRLSRQRICTCTRIKLKTAHSSVDRTNVVGSLLLDQSKDKQRT